MNKTIESFGYNIYNCRSGQNEEAAMNSGQFKKIIQEALVQKNITRGNEEKVAVFLNFLDEISSSMIEDFSMLTQMSLVFEGFYQSVSSDSNLKRTLLNIKIRRWHKHYGTPTVLFLLTYDKAISDIKLFFLSGSLDRGIPLLSILSTAKKTILDHNNHVYIDIDSASEIELPQEEETGKFTKTYNPSGGFTTTPCDPVSQKFLKYSEEIARTGGAILEIGAAFGATSLQALTKGATVYCNDIDAKNLAVVRRRYLHGIEESSLTGDDSSLVLVPGEFPDELSGLPKNFFDAILICRVMHFFTGAQIEKSLSSLSSFLKPGGRVFVVCETPFLKNWQKFIPEYERRLAEDVQWPGEINNPAEFESSGRAASLPKFVHWITKEIMERALNGTNFNIEHIDYIDRNGQFPEDLLFDGRESIGAIAIKPF